MKNIFILLFVLIAALSSHADVHILTIDCISYKIDTDLPEATVVGADHKIARAVIRPHVKCKGIAYPVTSISENAFWAHGRLVSVVIPGNITTIGDGAFYDCGALASVSIPSSVTSIGKRAFYNCRALTTVTIPRSVTAIAPYTFANCRGLTSVTLPATVTEVGESAFNGCVRLATVVIPESVTTIGAGAFAFCGSLTSVTVPSSVVTIAGRAFFSCSSLTSVSIRDSVTVIGDSAFENCSSLLSVTIPASVRSIGKGAFDRCDELAQIRVEDGCMNYSSVDGVLFDKDVTELITYPPGRLGAYVVPGSVVSIAGGAFGYCHRLTSVTMGAGVTSIGDYAFDSSSLTSVHLGESVTSIGMYAFAWCDRLATLAIPDAVAEIGRCAFIKCSALTSAAIGESVTSIPVGAFYGCDRLRSVNIPASVTTIGEDAFNSCAITSIAIPSSVTSIGMHAFQGCTALTDVYYPAENPVGAFSNVFEGITYQTATLWVPEKAVSKCPHIQPWNNFHNIRPYDFSNGIEDAIADFDASAPYEVYRLSGLKAGTNLDGLAPGIYIIRQGALTGKIAVR